MREKDAGFEDGPICGALIEFSRGGGQFSCGVQGDHCHARVVQGNLHGNVHDSAKDIEVFLSNYTSHSVGPSQTNPGNNIPKANNETTAPNESIPKKKKS